MKTIETKVFEFNELSDKAKENARQWWRDVSAGDGYSWADDSIKSLKSLAEHFDGRLKYYDIDWFNNSPSRSVFSMPEEMTATEIKSRLSRLGSYNKKTGRGNGDCKLTGYCSDESAIDGFRAAFKAGERDLNKLMQAAFAEWLKDCQSEALSQLEDDYIDDMLTGNEYTFTEDGKRFG